MDQATPVEEIDRSVSKIARTYRRRAAKGLCRYCGGTPRPGTHYCDHHLQLQMAKRAKWSAEQVAKGLCTKCVAKAAPNRMFCQRHLDLAREATRRRREQKKASA